MPVKPALFLALMALASFAIGFHDDQEGLIWLAIVLTGAAQLLLYRPDLMHGAWPARLPSGPELALIPLSGVGALCVLYGLDLLTEPFDRDLAVAPQIARRLVFAFAWIAPMLPAFAQIARNVRRPDRIAPLWPALAGGPAGALAAALLIGAVPLALESLLTGQRLGSDRLGAPAGFAVAALLGAVCFETWRRALIAGDAARIESKGVFATGIIAALAGIGVGTAFCIDVLIAANRQRILGPEDSAVALGALLVLPVIVAWVTTLVRLRHPRPRGPANGVAAIVLLCAAMPATLIPPVSIAATGMMAVLALIVIVPVTIVATAAAGMLLPLLVRKALGAAPAAEQAG